MLKLYQISNSKISLLYNGKFSKNLNDDNITTLFFQNETFNWMQNDIDIKNNKLTINGVGIIKDSLFRKINTLGGIKSSKFNFKSVVPLNFKKIERFSHNHFDYISNLKNFVVNQMAMFICQYWRPVELKSRFQISQKSQFSRFSSTGR